MTTKYTFISDQSHGWLQVPLPELKALGIENRISNFSYQDLSHRDRTENTGLGVVYLEEDCDAMIFIQAKIKKMTGENMTPESLEMFNADHTRTRQDNMLGSFIRNCDRYNHA